METSLHWGGVGELASHFSILAILQMRQQVQCTRGHLPTGCRGDIPTWPKPPFFQCIPDALRS